VPARGWRGGGVRTSTTLKTIIDMRNAENQQAAALAIRKQTIDELQRSNGYSPEMAAAKYDSGEYKDDLKQDTIAKREAAKLAGTDPDGSAEARERGRTLEAFRAAAGRHQGGHP
jgi:hypothetical protein